MTKLEDLLVGLLNRLFLAAAVSALMAGSAFAVDFPTSSCTGSDMRNAYDALEALFDAAAGDDELQQIYANQATYLNTCCGTTSPQKLCACHSPSVASAVSLTYNQQNCTSG
ncbi:hypothetical protein [Tropicimonas aquimaris]|uniref:Uncharacterized protein n=1 Tax=Tropicimonas aquimaris TaxID=914152 RepID=A0ABW3ITW8_9RHOB